MIRAGARPNTKAEKRKLREAKAKTPAEMMLEPDYEWSRGEEYRRGTGDEDRWVVEPKK